MIVLGDIGGTKSQFLILNNQQFTGQFLSFQNQNFCSFDELFNTLTSENLTKPLSACYLAVAGPVKNNHCVMTNLKWKLNGALLQQQNNGADFQLMNDLEATALSIPYLSAEGLTFLQGESLIPYETVSVMSVGTGLGQATLAYKMLTNNKKQLQVIGGEGGHCDFSPHNELEVQLLQFLWHQNRLQKIERPISLEQIISGQGLVNILNFFKQTNQEQFQEYPKNCSPRPNKNINAEIIRLAQAFPESIYKNTLDLFCDLLANELGNMVLRTISHGGAIVAGGMALRILPFINKTRYLARFADKDAFSVLLKSIPVAFCTNPKAPLVGLYHHYINPEARLT